MADGGAARTARDEVRGHLRTLAGSAFEPDGGGGDSGDERADVSPLARPVRGGGAGHDRRLGKASARRVPVDEESRMLELYRSRYSGFRVTHFVEKLCRHHGFTTELQLDQASACGTPAWWQRRPGAGRTARNGRGGHSPA